ncbi:AMP-binding protein [Diaphorobacter limosus]|uniref:AMP-binding protein n=1 Tax=Diaphorobacter limosus TaxID=3036128 RepID=A0ABZ0J7J8_9BURK|nr:AMP-binding protein [Diaphorobacter sp. Y-1]WOO34242.1 AMP-binding protein [Diaphorobacter sp. Y-1]
MTKSAATTPMATRPATLSGMLASAPGDAIALTFEGQTLTYDELRDQVAHMASGLRQQGLQAGDVLGIWLPNTPRWLILHLACASLGVASLSLNLKLGVKELVSFIDRSQCKALAFDRDIVNAHAPVNDAQAAHNAAFLAGNSLAQVWQQHAGSLRWLVDATVNTAAVNAPGWPALAEQIPSVTHCTPMWAAWTSLETTPVATVADDSATLAQRPCIILSSSGTTSMPKLIVHSQSNVALHAQDAAPAFGADASCSTLLALPICGAFGYTAAMMTLAAGATLVLHEVFQPAQAAVTLQQLAITHMFGTNDMVDKMIAPLTAGWQPKALRFFGHANFVPGLDELPAQAQRLGIPMVGCFGMSEILALFAHQDPAAPLERRAQAGGIPVTATAQVRARLVETGELAAPMEPGELEFRGPYMMQGYLGNAEATAKAFTDDGFLRSGDLGYVNGDGGFTHVSRLGDVLRIGGFLVDPAEIEEAVLSASGANACQVVAVNAAGSSRPVAFVVLDTGSAIDEDAIKTQLQQQIARYKVPIRILTVESFPYTMGPNGMKVKRNELRDLAQTLLAQEASK